MPLSRYIVYLIDDDASVRRSMGRVLTSAGLKWEAFASADDFLLAHPKGSAGCIVADMTMPGTSGLDLKRSLNQAASNTPVILLTAHDTEEMRLAAREAGAAAFFRKPVDAQALLDAIAWAAGTPAAVAV